MTTSPDLLTPSVELHAFLDACRAVGPDAVSACPGWTAHHVAAHQAATAGEIVRHLEPFLAGEPVPATRSFEVREAPFRTLGFDDLLEAVVAEDAAMRDAVARVLHRDPDADVPWTGRRMVVSTFPTHVRSEFALHRWDLVADDGPGRDLLAAPELTDHAVDVLGAILPTGPSGGGDLAVALRSPGRRDVLLEETADGSARLRRGFDGSTEATDEAAPALVLDAAARLLVLWGRHPQPPSRVRSTLDPADLRRVQHLLAGY